MMFGMDKPINTKADAESIFVQALDAAISQATSAGVGSRTIISHLKVRVEQQTPQWRHPSQSKIMYDGHGRPVDMNAKVAEARRERQRRLDAACEIPRDQRQVAASGYKVP